MNHNMDKQAIIDLFAKYGSDKMAKYADAYYDIFKVLLNRKSITILEIGIYYGDSSKALYELFAQNGCEVNFYGIDVHDSYKTRHFDMSFIKFFKGDQSDLSVIDDLLRSCSSFDLIIDDGSHIVSDMITSFTSLRHCLNKGGFYVIEDTNMTVNTAYTVISQNDVGYFENYIDKYNSGKKYTNQRDALNRLINYEIEFVDDIVDDINTRTIFKSIKISSGVFAFERNNANCMLPDLYHESRAAQLVFDDLRCVYSPLCKVASTSLFDYIGRRINAPNVDDIREYIFRNHTSSLTDLQLCEKRRGYYKFAMVRNPWHRAVSGYKELLRRYPFGEVKQDEPIGLSYSHIYTLMGGDTSFKSFINFISKIERKYTRAINCHWIPQAMALYLDKTGIEYRAQKNIHINYDFIGRLENAHDDFSTIMGHISGDTSSIEKIHSHKEYDYKSLYDNQELINAVGEYYEDDARLFGYTFE